MHSWYDANGNRTRVIYPDTDRELISHYDRANRMTRLDDGELLSSFGYDAAGNRTGHTSPYGVVTTAMFDELNRVISLSSRGDDGQAPTALNQVTYDYDLAGNRRNSTETIDGIGTRQLAWDYDDLSRLTSESWTGDAARTDEPRMNTNGHQSRRPLFPFVQIRVPSWAESSLFPAVAFLP